MAEEQDSNNGLKGWCSLSTFSSRTKFKLPRVVCAPGSYVTHGSKINCVYWSCCTDVPFLLPLREKTNLKKLFSVVEPVVFVLANDVFAAATRLHWSTKDVQPIAKGTQWTYSNQHENMESCFRGDCTFFKENLFRVCWGATILFKPHRR